MRLIRSRWVLAAAALTFMAAGFVPAGAVTRPEVPDSPQVQQPEGTAEFVPGPCPPALPSGDTSRCGELVVPEDRSRPDGREIRLAVAIIPAVSPTPAPQPMVYLTGGPGSDAMSDSETLTDAGLNANRDLVIISQRGTFSSTPHLVCPQVDKFRANSLDRRFTAQSTGADAADAAARCRRQLESEDIDLSAYNTSESATDVAELRTALGIEEWDVFSHSYGTDLALTYMRRYPEGIRSVTLDGTVPPSVASLGWTWKSFRQSFDNILQACEEDPTCKARYPNTEKTFTRLVNELEADPITTTVTLPDLDEQLEVTIDGGVLVNWLTRESHFAENIPMAIDELAHGRPDHVATQWATARFLPPENRGIFAHGLSYSVWCSEWVPYQSRAGELRDARRAFPKFPRSVLEQAPQLAFLREVCAKWNVPKAPESIRDVTESSIPTLAITGTYDAQTGAQWGAYVAETLPNSTVVEVPGVSHGAYFNPCAADVINSFLDNPDAPNTDCIASVQVPEFTILPRPGSTDLTTALAVTPIGSPRYVRASDGQIHVNYDLLVTNSFVGEVALDSLEVRAGGRVLQQLDAEQVAARTHPILQESEPLQSIPPSGSAMVLMDIPLTDASIPSRLDHRISYTLPEDTPANAVIDSTIVNAPRVDVPKRTAITIAPPLRGSGWWVGGGCCNPDQRHRGLLLSANGTLVTTEMFDIDWLQIVDGAIFSGDGSQLTDYPGYGAEIHSVAAGRVVTVVDDKPEAPLGGSNPDLQTADDFAGNQVVVKIAPRRYAFYAHFQPDSIRVRAGERVRAGQVLGLLGNSGNSAAPHLHFGIHDGPAPATSSSLPFRIDRYRYEGSGDLNEDGTVPLEGEPRSERNSYPLNLTSVTFESSGSGRE